MMRWQRQAFGVPVVFFFLVALFSLVSITESQEKVTPPEQPVNGPGGTAEEKFKVQKSTEGTGAKQYWVFEPQGMRGPAPVIGFLHGWNAVDPETYRAWIEHIVRRGNIVIYPVYQEGATERIPNMTPNAIEALRNAFSKLGRRADRSRFALVGHSLGGVMALNLAAFSASEKLPAPKALMSIMPGDTDATALANRARLLREGVNYRQIPRNTLALVVAGEEDTVVGDRTAKVLFSALGHVACENKNYVVVPSDRHGNPELIADHFAPSTARPEREETAGPLLRILRERMLKQTGEPRVQVDSLDYYAFWKLLDALTDSAFYGRNRGYALGGGRNQTFMGNWSDGRPVEPLQVSNDPACKNR